MRVWPQRPEELDIRASSNLGVESSRRRASKATGSVAAALNIGDGEVLNRSVALDWTGDTLRLGAHVRVGVWLVELKVLTANGGIADIAVGRNGGSESEGRGEVLHLQRVVENTSLRSER